MKNIFTIARREGATYFNSPIGYIYIIVFLLINSALYITPFFAYPRAEMREVFNFLPFILCVLLPLISMRLWAEDKKENTIEMLLTLPVKPYELVLGKYLASLVFYLFALIGTITIPLMLGFLGKPDWGVILCSYLGAIFLGAFFLGVGIFLSGLVRDQIIAAVISLGACFGLFLLGTDFIATFIDSAFNGLGTFLKNAVGVTNHYNNFCRGIIELNDIFYFIAWINIFLFLNGFYLEGRSRKNFRFSLASAIVLCLVGGLAFNYLIFDSSSFRLDCTDGKIYTVSKATKRMLSKLKVPVIVNYYVTPRDEMPTELKDLEQNVKDKLNEMSVASSGKLKYKIIHLHARKLLEGIEHAQTEAMNKDKKKAKRKKSLEESLLDKGIKPITANIIKDDKQSNQLVYSALGVAYLKNEEKIIPKIDRMNIFDLEYRIMSSILHITRTKKPIIVLVAPKEVIEIPPRVRMFYMQTGRPVPPNRTVDNYKMIEKRLSSDGYDVKRVDITKDSKMPKEYDAILVIGPVKFNKRQKWEIARALYSGKNVFIAAQSYTFDYQKMRRGIAINKKKEEHGVNDWLKDYGVTMDDEILMDVNHIPLAVGGANSLQDIFEGPTRVNLPTHIYITGQNMNQDISITSRVAQFPYLWGTSLDIDEAKIKENKLALKILMSTTNRAWKIPFTRTFIEKDFEEPPVGNQYTTMVMLEGKFPKVYNFDEAPSWPKSPKDKKDSKDLVEKEEAPANVESKQAKLIITGNALVFSDNFYNSSIGLLKNCTDAFALSEDLINIRSKRAKVRIIDRPTDFSRFLWKTINYLLIPILLIGFGLARFMIRKSRRNKYIKSLKSQNS